MIVAMVDPLMSGSTIVGWISTDQWIQWRLRPQDQGLVACHAMDWQSTGDIGPPGFQCSTTESALNINAFAKRGAP